MAKTEAEFLYKIGLVKTCLMEIDLAQSVTKLTLEFTDVGNELADMLFGENRLPPNDINTGENRLLFAQGYVL